MADRKSSGAEIAVIGVAGRFPGARDVEELWKNLVAGRESVSFFTPEELRGAGVSEEELANPDYVRANASLSDVDLFDAELFRMSPREASFLDPQQRLFLECAWEALERAGYDPARSKLRIGVFGGASISTYMLCNLASHPGAFGADKMHVMFGNGSDFMPTRVSYKLDLVGPSVNVQSACSTSLVAIHLACQNLLAGESDMILAGGSTVTVPQTAGYMYQRESIFSPDGHCRAFDAEAKGTINGSGVGVVLLKRLEDAIADRDEILAVILGGAVNNDGARKMGYTAPSVIGQADVIADALSVAGVTPDSIGYVEAHGTATALGDPIEVAALAQAFGEGLPASSCAIGSIKTNVGHLDIAAGIAGFIKTVLILKHRQIPPSLHFKSPNPSLNLERTPFFVNASLREWVDEGRPRRAGVSSFGIGGTNAHVVLEEAPEASTHRREAAELLVLSAKGTAALDEVSQRLANHLEANGNVNLADVAHTLRVGRQRFEDRRFVVATSAAEAIAALRSGEPKVVQGRRSQASMPRLVFMFPGQGSQYPNMALALYRGEEAFREDVHRCCALFEAVAGVPLLARMYPPSGSLEVAGAALEEPEVVQLALFTIEFALARQLERWGVRPAAVVGHSIGEYAAACVAGVLSLEDAVMAVAQRSRLMARTAPGAMLAVALEESAVRAIVGQGIDVAAVNGPASVVLSGSPAVVAAAERALSARGVETRRLRVKRANHSASMDPVVEPLRKELARVAFGAPQIPFMSTVSAQTLDAKTAGDPGYWAAQVRKPVRFGEATSALIAQGEAIFVEVGPGGTLSSLVRRQGASAIAMLPARAGIEEAHAPLAAIGELWSSGAEVDWEAFDDGMRRRVPLPTYPFQRKRHWIGPSTHRGPAEAPRSAEANANANAGTPPEARSGTDARQAPPAGDVAPRTRIEAAICKIWEELLGVERVGLDDDFYALGGDSLLGTQVASRIRTLLRVDLRVRDLFEAPTVGALSRIVEQREELEEAPLERRAPGVAAVLSFAQERLWFLDQLAPGSAAYNIPGALRLVGELDVHALQAALNEVGRRHEALRTTFVADASGMPVPVVHQASEIALATIPIGDRGEAHVGREERERKVLEVARREAGAPFDLQRGPLVRAKLLSLDANEHVLLLAMHHIVSDGWSVGVLVREITALYKSFSAGKAPELEDLPIQYADYASWQRAKLTGAELERQLTYWTKELEGAPAVLELPTDRLRPAAQTFAGAHLRRSLSASEAAALDALTRRLGATPFMVFLAAYGVFLSRVTGQRDLVIGVPIANRTRSETEALVGMFVNTLALRMDLGGSPTFLELVGNVKARTLAAYAHQDLPFERLVEALNVERDMSRAPVFQTMFTLQNTPSEEIEVSGLRVSALEVESGMAQLDLSLDAVPTRDGYELRWEYNTDLFEPATVERMATHFQNLLARIVAQPDDVVWQFPLLTEGEERQLLVDWNQTAEDYPKDQTVQGLFEEQARRTPDAPALEHEGVVLSYAELDARANALAQRLASAGVARSSLVAVCMERSVETIVTLLAVLKAGGAYVPIDPRYPRERIAYMLADSRARVVASNLDAAFGGLTVVRPTESESATRHLRPDPQAEATDPAYVIYTSGSTGQPKGVVVEHRAAVNYLLSFGRLMGLGKTDRVLQFASLSFDVSVEEIFGSLSHGAALVLRSEEMLGSVEAFLAFVAEHRVTVLDLPTAFWNELTTALAGGARLPACVRLVVLGGEKVQRSVLVQWLGATPRSVRLMNGYGPTEATIAATFAELAEAPAGEVPIGRPVANTVGHVLDAFGRPSPIGVPGELYLGGDNLARGYLHRPELTAEKFVANPFGAGRLYRTGDRVRRLPDGVLQFVGRFDDQVKVRGFRIELGEVEATLLSSPHVREAVVLARGEGAARRLHAYVVASGDSPKVEVLRDHLAQRLPDYMVPSTFELLEALPHLPNGKVDRNALPASQDGTTPSGYLPPRTELEIALCEIWQEILKVERVGIEDDFFSLGGSSLLVLRLSAVARQRLGLDLSVSAIMSQPTIAALARGTLSGSHLVRLGGGPGTSAEVVVFVHSLSGEVFPYLELARALPHHETYGLRSPLADAGGAIGTLEELAKLHADAVEGLARPVHVVGWSSGGVIAHEVARQLAARGCAARTLTLLDPFVPGEGEESVPEYVLALVSLVGGIPLPRVAEGSEDAVLLAAEVLQCDVQTARTLMDLQMKHHRLVMTHEPTMVSTPTLLCVCGEREDLTRWNRVAPIERARVEGTHDTMLQGKCASGLAGRLERHFTQGA